MAIPIVLYMIVDSFLQDSNYERNRVPKEDVRQASSIATMWVSGFSASNLPSMSPSAGLALIRKTLDSKADEEVKIEAREIEKRLNRYPDYVRFADRINTFRDDFDQMRATVANGLKASKPANAKEITNFEPGCLVTTAGQHGSRNPDPEADVLMFEPYMIAALGDKVATSPSELKTLIALVFERTEVGEYQVEVSLEKGKPSRPLEGVKFPAYAHGCRAYVIDYETGNVIHVQEWLEDDPESRKMNFPGSTGNSEPDGYARIRVRVRRWIQEMATSSKTGKIESDD